MAINALADSGLQPIAYQCLRNFEGMPQAQRERKLAIARQMFDQMRSLGCDTVVLCSNIAPDSSGDRGRIVDDLRQLGELAAQYQVRVAYESICWGRWIRDYRDGWALIRKVDHPNIGMVLDSFHVFALDLPVEPIADIAGDKVFLVEVADLPKINLDFVELSRSFRLFPGEGATPIDSFIKQVDRIDYRGLCAVEVFNAYYLNLEVDAVAQRAMTSMKRLFGG